MSLPTFGGYNGLSPEVEVTISNEADVGGTSVSILMKPILFSILINGLGSVASQG